YAESSPAIGTALNPYIGYEEAGRVIKKAMAENKTLREVILEEGLMDEDDVDRARDVVAMTKGGILWRLLVCAGFRGLCPRKPAQTGIRRVLVLPVRRPGRWATG